MIYAERISSTIRYLRLCRQFRAAGGVSDPRWLVHMAINRRAGWPDDPSFLRGSSMPVNGRYPRRASGDEWSCLQRFARSVNTPRLIVRDRDCPKHLRSRFANRLTVTVSR